MLWTEQLFHVKKPIIAMLHLAPLPGYPRFRYGDSMAVVVAHAKTDLAATVDAVFARGTFSGVYVGDGGLYNNDFSALLRRRAALHLDALKMLYFINPESDRNVAPRPLSEIACSTIFKTHPDGLCISANAAAQDVDDALIASVKQAVREVAVLCNTGCRQDTIARKLRLGDAAVVGTYFKEGGKLKSERLENLRVDIRRVREFMDMVYRFRAELEGCEK